MGCSPTRVLLDVSSKSCHWQQACESPEEIVKLALDAIQEKKRLSIDASVPPEHTLLATEKWTPRVFIVFDLFNESYDPDTAHLPGRNDLPVFSIYFSQKGEEETIGLGAPSQGITNRVNAEVRAIFDATGPGSRPPFRIDHLHGNVPCYPNPRSLVRAVDCK